MKKAPATYMARVVRKAPAPNRKPTPKTISKALAGSGTALAVTCIDTDSKPVAVSLPKVVSTSYHCCGSCSCAPEIFSSSAVAAIPRNPGEGIQPSPPFASELRT